jgi:hypothetical protein
VYDDTEVSFALISVAFSSCLTPGRDLSDLWVVDSACSIELTAFRGDFATFEPPLGSSHIGGVGVNVQGSGIVRLAIPLVSGQIIHRIVHAMYTPDLSSRSTQRISRLLGVRWMQSHCDCVFLFATSPHLGLLVVPTGMGVLKPSRNGLYLLSNTTRSQGTPPLDTSAVVDSSVALIAHLDPELWHRCCGHLNMQSLQAQYAYGVPTIPVLVGYVKTVFCDSWLLHKASTAPRNTFACPKPPRPLMNMSSDIWGPVNVPSPHGLRYCALVIDHHTNYMWVRFLKSKDDTCPQLESILLKIRHTFTRGATPPPVPSPPC